MSLPLGDRYTSDVVIDGGRIRRRGKGPSKALRHLFGRTPLSVAEDVPRGGKRLIVGTGVNGALPVAPEVYQEGARRRIAIEALPTRDACRLLAELKQKDVCRRSFTSPAEREPRRTMPPSCCPVRESP